MILTAVLLGVGVLLAGGLPWSLLFAPANLRIGTAVPWAIVPMAIYLWAYWTYIGGGWGPRDTAAARREYLRANPLTGDVWMMSIGAGLIGFGAVVAFLTAMARVIELPASAAPITAPGGMAPAILVNGAAFGLLHFPNHPDAVLTMLPYYIAVAAVYGGLTWAVNSILPALVLHAGGNVWSLGRL